MTALDAALEAGRREHEAIMRDQVRVWRPGPEVFNRSTGVSTPGAPLELYSGRARVKPFGRGASTGAQAGEREIVLREFVVSLPFSAALPAGQMLLPGDQIEVVAAEDPRMAGRTLWATAQQLNSQATAWRIGAEDRS